MPKLTFYGHFTGNSSYPMVCRAIAGWMVSQDIDVSLVNLRGAPIEGELAGHQAALSSEAELPGPALLFGFPSWLDCVPHHHPMLSYHVGDVSPLPADWSTPINERSDQVLTPSLWCADLLSGLGIKSSVVRHGIDPQVCRPADDDNPPERIILRHFCSSPFLARKGTVETLQAAVALLSLGGFADVLVRVSAPAKCVPALSRQYAGHFYGGQIDIVVDEPRSAEDMAEELRSVTAVVQPSRAEGFGLIPLEAVACGTPVVLTDATGHCEYAKSLGAAALEVRTTGFGRCGEGSAPVLDPLSLRSAMEESIRERTVLRQCARDASPFIRQEWSWRAILDAELLPILASLDVFP